MPGVAALVLGRAFHRRGRVLRIEDADAGRHALDHYGHGDGRTLSLGPKAQ